MWEKLFQVKKQKRTECLKSALGHCRSALAFPLAESNVGGLLGVNWLISFTLWASVASYALGLFALGQYIQWASRKEGGVPLVLNVRGKLKN